MLFLTPNKEYRNVRAGYTLIELVVAIGLFATVALMASSAFLGVVSSNKKTLAIRTTMNNLNSAIESMSRDIKTGLRYHCEPALTPGATDAPSDCSSPDGGGYIALEKQGGDFTTTSDQVVYRLGSGGNPNCSNTQICKSVDGGTNFFAVTAPELSITGLAFRVFGTSPGDKKQPRVVIVITGSSGTGNEKSTFSIETTVSQRLPDQF